MLARRGFIPPHATKLPEGTPAQVATALGARSVEDLEALARTIVTLPDPARVPAEAAATMELLLLTPAHEDRARRLLERMPGHVDDGEVALWRFRLEAGARDDGADRDWQALLDPLRRLGGPALPPALRMAASELLSAARALGVDWLVSVLGGRRVANARLALARRPALGDELSEVFELLLEAERAEAHLDLAAVDPVETLLAAAEAADLGGDFSAGTEHLEAALTRSGGRDDLAAALAARAAALLDPALAARARHHGAEPESIDACEGALEPPEVVAPRAPLQGWSALIEASARGAAADPSFFEAAGARQRAARAWLAGDVLLQAWRLRDELTSADRERLLAALREAAPEDEAELASSPAQTALARALHAALPEGLERRVLGLRLRGAASRSGGAAPPREVSGEVAAGVADDDPHSPASRLAAAADLSDLERHDAAATVLAALIRRCDDEEAFPRLLALTLALLRRESPPLELLGQVERAMLSDAPLGAALRGALAGDPLAAYALHEALHRAACERTRTDPVRVTLLEAWLGIWAATRTPPAASAISALMHADAALLPLAASRLSGREDPVAAAAEFLAAHPALETTPASYGEALLAWATGG